MKIGREREERVVRKERRDDWRVFKGVKKREGMWNEEAAARKEVQPYSCAPQRSVEEWSKKIRKRHTKT